MQKQMHVTCVLVTHDPGLAARTNRIVTFEDGRVVDVRNTV